MKKLRALPALLTCMFLASCMHRDNNLSITYSNSDRYYSMKASFDKHKTRAVERYMDSRIGNRGNISFVNTLLDGTMALDDNTKFHIEKFPGVVKIKLDKRENSEEAYQRIRSMCEGIKGVLTNEE